MTDQPKTIGQFLKELPASRVLHLSILLIAGGLFWHTHRKLPDIEELGAAALLLGTKFDRVLALIGVGGGSATQPPPPAAPSPPAAIALLVGFLVLPLACAGGGLPPSVIAVGNCAVTAVHDVALNVLSSVETALATGNYTAELFKLVEKFGVDAVSCAVQEVMDAAHTNAMRSGDMLEMAKEGRAKAWLEDHPVKP